jgi:glutathione S-transferase
MGRYTLHGHYGWGSVLTEAQLDWYGLPYDFVDVGDLFEDPVAQKKLVKINPLGQVRFVPGDKAAKGFRANVDEYAKSLWRMVGQEAQAPWFLGERFSALDIYLCAMTRWRPNRPWFSANAPKLVAAAERCNELPKLKPVWLRNYPPEGQ